MQFIINNSFIDDSRTILQKLHNGWERIKTTVSKQIQSEKKTGNPPFIRPYPILSHTHNICTEIHVSVSTKITILNMKFYHSAHLYNVIHQTEKQSNDNNLILNIRDRYPRNDLRHPATIVSPSNLNITGATLPSFFLQKFSRMSPHPIATND